MALRKVMSYIDDEVLRKKSRPVEKIDKRISVLIDDMLETMYSSNGVGLAAPQVGILKRIIVVDVGEGAIKLINPELIEIEGEQQDFEGCLSVPGIAGEVKRPEKVKVKALDEKGDTIMIEGTGLLARAFCHEIDHLDGILFIDKIVPGTKKNI
jgi:peptide deformylase